MLRLPLPQTEKGRPMKRIFRPALTLACSADHPGRHNRIETPLCEAAETGRVIELVYDQDESKGRFRLLDVHQVGLGNNGQLYLHGWQTRGCTKGRDYESERIFRLTRSSPST